MGREEEEGRGEEEEGGGGSRAGQPAGLLSALSGRCGQAVLASVLQGRAAEFHPVAALVHSRLDRHLVDVQQRSRQS